MDYINRNISYQNWLHLWWKSTNNKLVSLIKDINDRIEILSGSNSFEDFKINIRDWRLKGNTKWEDSETKNIN
jgi:hypothetical protein